MIHGVRGYHVGCRCQVCTGAKTMSMKRYRVRKARNHGEPLLLPAEQTRQRMLDLHKAIGSWAEIGRRLGFSTQRAHRLAHRPATVRPTTAAAVSRLWADYCQPIDRLPRVPIGPLKEAIERVYGTPLERMKGERPPAPLAKVDVALISHVATLRVDRAEKICLDLGIYPEDVWGFEWFGIEEAG